ncbi:alanine-phosphoribitol ligase [Sphaerisporangium krabiense]|uniref:Styrene monooxygenase StyA putative substrate binding domain-containing protein n=1 Tax=Sphaerisporangium krabiense TaxID=763782 RepID=A0A7W9DNV8_9ACTN|nr:styrene monooxygenase/indole monooxygenase family protein [Sphaerisporangium krabiense]MBB5625762.1 hypothetical protein [Sphaerisporangium krabiense]GII62902.1 alanine-phosphoribitol ligase [Sphaerisporangium krabiense]
MTSSGIGIVGTGISGLTLALRLQQLGVEVTLYAEKTADELRAGRLPNTVARMRRAQEREEILGSVHGRLEGSLVSGARVHVGGTPPLEFRGTLADPFHAADFRVLLPALYDDYTARGGRVVPTPEPPGAREVDAWSAGHELMVVAAGRRSVAELFPRDGRRSPYDRPRRSLLAGLYTGVTLNGFFSYNVSPGAGEVFSLPMVAHGGMVTGILVEAIPGGPIEPATKLSYRENPGLFLHLLEKTLAEHAPRLAERIEPGAFDLLGPDDVLQGGVTPVVRRPFATLPSGRIALAIGDAWITNDPITGQGANLGSHCAWVTADAIAGGGPYDEEFARSLATEMWKVAGPVTDWTNAFLGTPPDHVLRLFGAAARDPFVADHFVNLFGDPVRAWALLGDPDAVDALLASRAGLLSEEGSPATGEV